MGNGISGLSNSVTQQHTVDNLGNTTKEDQNHNLGNFDNSLLKEIGSYLLVDGISGDIGRLAVTNKHLSTTMMQEPYKGDKSLLKIQAVLFEETLNQRVEKVAGVNLHKLPKEQLAELKNLLVEAIKLEKKVLPINPKTSGSELQAGIYREQLFELYDQIRVKKKPPEKEISLIPLLQLQEEIARQTQNYSLGELNMEEYSNNISALINGLGS